MSEQDTTPMVQGALGMIEPAESFEIRLRQFTKLAEGVIAAGLAPKGMAKPASVVIAMQTGHELGLPPMQSMKHITVINGRSGIMGEAALGLLRSRGVLKPGTQLESRFEGEGDEKVCVVELHRLGNEMPSEARFGVLDAKRARLWGKSGPWTEYPQRMLMWRALGFLLRDHFSDVLMGLPLMEEIRDIPSAVTGTDFTGSPADPGEDPLLQQALGHEEPDSYTGPDRGVEDAVIIEEDPVAPDPPVLPAKEITCACGSKDHYPHGITSPCVVDCGRQIYVNEKGTGMSIGWIPGREPVPEWPEGCEEWCDLEVGHEGKCEKIPTLPPLEEGEEPTATDYKELLCRCGFRTLVAPGTPSPVLCGNEECPRRFRKVQRGAKKGDIVNEKDPDWTPPTPPGEADANQEVML